MDDQGAEYNLFKAEAATHFFNLTYQHIDTERKAIVDKGLKIPDKNFCGKCKHSRVKKKMKRHLESWLKADKETRKTKEEEVAAHERAMADEDSRFQAQLSRGKDSPIKINQQDTGAGKISSDQHQTTAKEEAKNVTQEVLAEEDSSKSTRSNPKSEKEWRRAKGRRPPQHCCFEWL